ncbi:MAG: 6,7-dimethyl-8-ribityllumazine synthase [Oscillatoria sp. PMC 1051.18]|uniref:6,7-dimethyl-8-ribityllumazine synthase n=1 Tax=Oscillatoria salina TaxID=331517 RepID=UPI0013BC0894|nr:6,7-dimethyl-8-ribityllumazine synthase [Oscillatoria salina]MBZ8179082.1 6,7-dimethyl-8-ribityllumazine synthase [Oscillatoria salina IIICB1]MEC4896190.1 6,7-dimethyl-8-ribityllumazine synthase [Oscillatoria sp. PMC 1050.18]MEC5030597.1 6,7-dimethyl-8-ribityllumazine synthase [Oscillatoria sp. PMC 1051.18]NET88818.1 6,7-dimethyl-8-ribityllumazine synthase [Kamptonema sp. SIO1D9]
MAVFEGTFTQSPSDLRLAIAIGRFNDLVTDKLLSGCQDCLKRHGIDVNPQGTQVDYVWVPGSFEIPVVARRLAMSGRYDAIICLGAVIRGQTPHFDYVAAEVAKGVAAAGFQTGVPVVFGVLTADTMQQALERAGIKSNHGWNYAMNALEMASLMRQINDKISIQSYPPYDRATPALPVSPGEELSSSESSVSQSENK